MSRDIFTALYEPKEWSGGCTYDPSWVDKLYRGLKRNTSRDFTLKVITTYPQEDFEEPVVAIPYIDERSPGNWMGITEVFRGDLGDAPRIVMGLDTIIRGNVDWLLEYSGDFAFTRAHVIPYETKNAHVCNAVVAWRPECGERLWSNLQANWDRVCKRSLAPWSKGVASEMVYWREAMETGEFDVLDDLYPGELASFNLQWTQGEQTASIVYFHGRSKPHLATPELMEHWV